jgi:DNA-binding SARP family transcriptional activator/ABC-type branched-subunit amino acid transport system substrate-binding protein
MDFRVLGPLEVSEGGRLVDLGGPTQRALLAVLLLNASEVVSTDRLIDELWGDEPPATAVKSLQAHVSRLRRALNGAENGRLETRGRGYVLHVRPGELDADRFRHLLEDARRRLADDDADGAAESLDEALALWRGPALADLGRNRLARSEIAHLDELRLAAIEERIEADLARGRHTALIPELERLVAQHPLRERLRGQLMLALYRADRQAEALSVYQDGRRALAEDLGLEPSESLRRLEGQILQQDRALAAPPAAPPSRSATAPPRPRTRLLVMSALVLAAAVVIAVFQLVREGDAGPSGGSAEEPGARALDPRTGAQIASVPLGSAPSTIAIGEGAIWVLDADDRTISRIDPSGRSRVRTFSTASTPTGIGVGAGAVWVGNAFRRGGFAGTSYPQSVSRLDPATGDLEDTIELPRPSGHPYFQGGGFNKQPLAVTEEAVWVVNTDQTVSRIDPRTNRIVARVRDVRAADLAAGPGGVWATASLGPDADGVVRIDPRTNEVAQKIEIAAESLTAPAVGAGVVWLADPAGGSVWRVDPGPDPLLRQVTLDVGVRSLAFGRGALWATNEVANKVYRIDPGTNRARVVSRTVAPQRVAVGDGAVWVTALGPPSGRETLPASACGELVSGGGGRPQLLIASDLPLQGDPRSFTAPMVDGIRRVLEERGFRAGPFRVGYRSCDVSTAQAGGTDVFRCLANGSAYARSLEVVGVIGSFHSFCSELQIPTLNRAPEGPLAMISPSNTGMELTRPYAGMRRGELARLYPSGERNYFRIAAADHLAPLALVETALQLGRERVYVLWDRSDHPYSAAVGAEMQREAPQRGLELAGAAGWSAQDRSFAGLARDVAAARPDAVLMFGAAPPHQDALIADLRARLGPRVPLIASDGFMGLVFEPAPFAEGMYVANYGIPNSHLPPAGRRFLRRFARGRPDGPGPDAGAAYTAQAAEILLDAIARSDGTRRSVTRELRRTRVEDGILGDIRFDRYGDLVEGPFTIYRVRQSGAVVDRVVEVGASSR